MLQAHKIILSILFSTNFILAQAAQFDLKKKKIH